MIVRSMKTTTTTSNKLETLLASAAASFIPVGVFFTSHKALGMSLSQSWPLWIISIAGLIYSIPSVVSWAQSWTGTRSKAIGFTVMLEGLMVLSGEMWLSVVALLLLGGVNAMIACHKVKSMRVSTFKVRASRKVSRPKNVRQFKVAA